MFPDVKKKKKKDETEQPWITRLTTVLTISSHLCRKQTRYYFIFNSVQLHWERKSVQEEKHLFAAALTVVLVAFFSRALADILRQQGPIPISQYDCENFAAMNGSPKDNTPVRTSSKNHYTPVHTSKSNHGKSSPLSPLNTQSFTSIH